MEAKLHLANRDLAVSVSRHGGVLTGATADGRDFLRPSQGRSATENACFPMVPLCNRVAENRFAFAGQEYRFSPNAEDPFYLHGDGWLAEWEVSHYSTDQATLSFTHAEGPFRYIAQQTIRLDGKTLHLGLSVRNIGPKAAPFGLGFHPYFCRDGALLQFAAAARWTEGPHHLPKATAPIPPDLDFAKARALPTASQNNAYEGWQGRAHIRWPDRELAVDLRADPLFGTLMLYAPDDDHSFFCIEPMSHLPNALNMPGQPGLHVLAPESSLAGEIHMTVTTTEPQA